MNDDDIDYEQAAQELLIEAKQGDAESQCLLGQMYYEGVGVRQDYKQAALWFIKAAKHQHAESQYYLGLLYQNGQGVQQNQKEAESWFQRAAKLGNTDAKTALAEIAKSRDKAATFAPDKVNDNAPIITDDGDLLTKEKNKPSELHEQKMSEKPFAESSDEKKKNSVSESSTSAINIPESRGSSKIKKTIIMSAVLIILAVAGYFEYSRVMLDKAKSKHEEELTNYKNRLSSIIDTMSDGAFWSEYTCSLIHDVWYNSIHKKRSNNTDKYTTYYGTFHDDFNTALQKLMSSSEFTSRIGLVKINQLNAENYMKLLKNPPEEFKSAYSVLLDLYEAYTELNNLAINPKGTFISYTTNCNNASASFSKYHKMIQIYR